MALTTTLGTNILANLAKPMFAGGPTDVVATPDVYTVNSNNVINTPVGKFSSYDGSSILNSFQQRATGFLTSITQTAATALASGYSISFAGSTIQNRLQVTAGQAVSSLAFGLQNVIAQNVAGLTSTAFGEIETVIGGQTQTIQTSDFESATNSLQLANQLSGVSNLITINDVGSSTALLTSVTSSLITLGLSAAVGALVNNTSGTMATATKRALAANVQQAVNASDLASIQLCITQLGIGGVLQQMPNAGLTLVQTYKMPSGTTASGYAALATTFLGILNQLAPAWDTTTRNGASVPSLTYFAKASQDALTLLKTQTAYLIPCLIASTYPAQDMVKALRQEYPTAVTL